jgi:HD superfamily phosphohydrolase YqeK
MPGRSISATPDPETPIPLHPLVQRAAGGELPDWAVANARRREHIERVRRLLETWAGALELSERERIRWCAAGTLHDVLRDAPPEELRARVPPSFRHLPGKVLHGPAAAVRLRRAGVRDRGLLRAVACHTLGHPGLDAAGRALFVADVVEPGRRDRSGWRRTLRERYPRNSAEVLAEVIRARLTWQLEAGNRLDARSVGFWNARGAARIDAAERGPPDTAAPEAPS